MLHTLWQLYSAAQPTMLHLIPSLEAPILATPAVLKPTAQQPQHCSDTMS